MQVGGLLSAYFPEALLDTPLGYEEMAAAGGLLGHGGVVVFDETVNLAAQARFAFEFCAAESCGKCPPCRIGAVRGMEIVDRILAGIELAKNFAVFDDLCETMTDASLCATGRPDFSAGQKRADPFDAESRGVQDGDLVALESRSGDIALRARISERMQPGVVYTTFHHAKTGATVITTDFSD